MHGRGDFVIDEDGVGDLAIDSRGQGLIAFEYAIIHARQHDAARGAGAVAIYAHLRTRSHAVIVFAGEVDTRTGLTAKGDRKATFGRRRVAGGDRQRGRAAILAEHRHIEAGDGNAGCGLVIGNSDVFAGVGAQYNTGRGVADGQRRGFRAFENIVIDHGKGGLARS